jgi:hypothetical protein
MLLPKNWASTNQRTDGRHGAEMTWTQDKLRAVVLDILERAGWSAGQVFFATLLVGGTAVSVTNLPWKYATVLAVSAGVGSVILTVLQYLVKITDLAFWPDLGIRLVKTFLASIAGSIATSTIFDITTFDWAPALNVAAVATLAALAKGLLARGGGSTTPPQNVGGRPAGGRGAPVEPPRQKVSAPNPSTLPSDVYLQAVRT